MADYRAQRRAAAADQVTPATTLPGGSGTTVTAGSTTLDFGAQGDQYASVAVAGQASILLTSTVKAWIAAVATADHNVDEHKMAPIQVTCSAPTAGVGFTIYGVCLEELTGKFTVNWEWS